jgi:antirestriction protein ArdC
MSEKKDAYAMVTDSIIEALEAGVVPWHKPWASLPGAGGPTSLSTMKPYRGINVLILGMQAMMKGYDSPFWLTFKQAKERGGCVRKGEKGTQVVLWKPVASKKDDNGETVKDGYLMLRYFTVFNAEQCDGITVPEIEELPPFDPIEACETIALGYSSVQVKHGGDRAYYSPALDYVQMPQAASFDTNEHYYGTLFHELAHSTGHSSRLARKSLISPAPFGSPDYSREELVAEIASAFLCGEAGIEVNVQHHAGYIASWLKVLKEDRKAIVTAAAQAQKAADMILGREAYKPAAVEEQVLVAA